MRAGGCMVQQTLTMEAAGVIKAAMNLARRRGHAQVTPLHVAASLLPQEGAGMGVLRRACIKSHPHSGSHPLRCRALELCFNVALNRLPTVSGHLMSGQPALSNALVAALKRAQAHQRRGCLEQQQQQQQTPLLAIKVEMEQLIISILDDPSVSRVMREAGFSSTFVKNNLEETLSVTVFPSMKESSISMVYPPSTVAADNSVLCSGNGSANNEDIASVVHVMTTKRKRNTVIVGDSFLSTENVVRELMIRIDRGDVPQVLRGARFFTPQFWSPGLRLFSRESVEEKILDLKNNLHGHLAVGPAVLYVGDLRWIVESEGVNNGYCPIEHIVMEIQRILVSYVDSGRLWLMATATYQTYTKCQARQPSLEQAWALHAVPVPSGGLDLSLHSSSPRNSDTRSSVMVRIPQNVQWPIQEAMKPVNLEGEDMESLSCCEECVVNFQTEAQNLSFDDKEQRLPAWLQQSNNNEILQMKIKELHHRWNQNCRLHHPKSQTLKPWWSFSMGSSVSNPPSHSIPLPTLTSQDSKLETGEEEEEAQVEGELKITLGLGLPNTKSTCPEDISRILAEKIPWQSKATISQLSSIILDCKARKLSRQHGVAKSDLWMLLDGSDKLAKKNLAEAVAECISGSSNDLLKLSFSTPDDDDDVEDQYQQQHSMYGRTKIDRIVDHLRGNHQSVVLLQDIDRAENVLLNSINTSMERGRLTDSHGREVVLQNCIFLMTKTTNPNSKLDLPNSGLQLDHGKICSEGCAFRLRMAFEEKTMPSRKRRAVTQEHCCKKMKLDLNMEAERGSKMEEDEEESGHSDLTQDSSIVMLQEGAKNTVLQFLHDNTHESQSLWTRLTRNVDKHLEMSPPCDHIRRMGEFLVERLRQAFEKVTHCSEGLRVEASAVEKIISCCYFMHPSDAEILLGKWVDEVFFSHLDNDHRLRGSQTRVTVEALPTNRRSMSTSPMFHHSRLPVSIDVAELTDTHSFKECLFPAP